MKYIVSMSGGKDSTACLLYALNNLNRDDVIPVFIDTKWEHELTYEYLDYLEHKLNISIIRLESEGMLSLCIRKKFMPNRIMRFCTEELKIKPFNKWLYENFVSKNIDFIVIQGIRRDESKSRENTLTFVEKKQTYNGRSFIVKVLYPIAYWSEKEVFEYIAKNGIEVNPLYKRGFKRVGCYPCVFGNKYELMLLADDNKYLQRLRNLENEISKILNKKVTFFPPERDKFLRSKSLFASPDYQGG